MNRRIFLQMLRRILGFGGGAIMMPWLPFGLARILAPPASAAPHKHLRPPGALKDDTAFTEACIGCGLCAEVCPPRCIRFYKRDGGDKVNTPYINPEDKSCILCMKCGTACPTNAIREIPHKKRAILEQVDMGTARIDRAACYPWVDKGICGACASVCPLGADAIGFAFANFYRPVIKDGCVGCGQCVDVCPHPSLPIRIVDRSMGTVARHVNRLQNS